MTKSVFAYRNGVLCAEAMPLEEIAEQMDTPFYCTSAKQLGRNIHAMTSALGEVPMTVHYALKANGTLAVVRTLAQAGAGGEVTSTGELERALDAGIPAEKIIFTGGGKSRDDLAAALLAGAGRIQIESLSELVLVDQVATVLGKTAPVAIRLNLGACSPTGGDSALSRPESKFGLPLDHLAEALRYTLSSSALRFKGLSVHAGSNIVQIERFRQVFQKLVSVVELLRAQGLTVETLHLGGGLGHDSALTDLLQEYVHLVRDCFGNLGCALSLSSGRRLVGDAGALVTRVLHVKETGDRRYLVVDAGANDLVRPALCGARHEIIPVREAKNGALKRFAVVGSVSDVSDQFGDLYLLSTPKAGDLLAIMQAGAYGSAMASTYNGRALVPEVLVSAAQYAVIRRRVAVTEQLTWESYPEWLETTCAA